MFVICTKYTNIICLKQIYHMTSRLGVKYCHAIIPTQCFYRFLAILIGPLVKLNGFYTSIKTRAYEYLITALISPLLVLSDVT